jgi:hypothetical protein
MPEKNNKEENSRLLENFVRYTSIYTLGSAGAGCMAYSLSHNVYVGLIVSLLSATSCTLMEIYARKKKIL